MLRHVVGPEQGVVHEGLREHLALVDDQPLARA